jgi:hypothetical protein
MSSVAENSGRLSTCFGKTLAQVKLESEENHYPITVDFEK